MKPSLRRLLRAGLLGLIAVLLAFGPLFAIAQGDDDPLTGGSTAGTATGGESGGEAISGPVLGGQPDGDIGRAMQALQDSAPAGWLWLGGMLLFSYLVGWLILRVLVKHESPGNAGCFGCFSAIGFWLLFAAFILFGYIVREPLPNFLTWTIAGLLLFGLIVMAFRLTGTRRIVALVIGLLLILGFALVAPQFSPAATGGTGAMRGGSEADVTAQRAVMKVVAGSSTGSAFFVSRDGKAFTNAHVVGGNQSVSVELSDGRTAQAAVVKRDSNKDLAVLKVAIDDAPFLNLGNSDTIKTLTPVIAIGFPLGMASVTNGTVSNPNAEGLIAINANVNPGNSGGPLIDAQSGLVIGIVVGTIRDTPAGTMEGMNFAIPINVAKKLL
ncbi:MAG TPA: trypsin-like peptidase domain-containing protein [Fimbriimonadaceae bacterium]|nr:trypsin-like peptidase domain-containing protein [Fimbriimonadaceae bacterium]HRJ97356.1 trypsin-like peptidase domain-containing protein [Fimbriimonadaceae bacterium]